MRWNISNKLFGETNTCNIENTKFIFKAVVQQSIKFEVKKLAEFKELILSKFLIYRVALLMRWQFLKFLVQHEYIYIKERKL